MLTATSSAAFIPPAPTGNRWRRLADFLARRRVRISVFIFAALIVEDVLTGVKPHDIFNPRDWESVLGCGLVFAGLALRSWAAGVLRKTRELTTTGPYALIRNPLYLGSFLIMSGFCALIDDAENVFFIVGPVAGLYFLQVLHEERLLEKLYESRWLEYARRVPRFVPRSLPKAPLATWDIRHWLGSREYRGLGGTLLGMLLLEVWRAT
jgi:protein-S-isoprenylcysteine O-methyltransferase Ste14